MSFAYSLFLGSIAFVRVVATTDGQHKRRGKLEGNLQLKIVLSDDSEHLAKLKRKDVKDQQYEEEVNTNSDFDPQLDCTRRDKRKVYLMGKGNNRWYVASINTYTKESGSAVYTQLTADPGFSMWVDGIEEHEYSYNATEHLLTNAIAGSCITYIRVMGQISPRRSLETFFLRIQLHDQSLQAELEGRPTKSNQYKRELNFRSWFRTTECVSISDIKKVYLKAHPRGNKRWYIESFSTSLKTGEVEYMDLTSDPHLNKPFGAKGEEVINLTWALEETVNCEYGNPTCECMIYAAVCTFNLEIDGG